MKKLKCILEGISYLMIIFLVWEIVYYLYNYLVQNLISGEYSHIFPIGILRFLTQQAEYIYIIVGWIISISIILLILKFPKKKIFYGEKRRLRLSNIVMSMIIGFGIIFIVNGIISLFNEYYSLNSFFMNSVQLTSLSIIQSIVILGILLPIFEEILFRGLILSKLTESLSSSSAIIIQSGLFAISHFNIIQGSYALILGLVTGISTLKTKTIKSSILIHVTFNIGNLFLYNTNIETYDLKGLIIFLALGLLLLFFGIDKLQKDKIVLKN